MYPTQGSSHIRSHKGTQKKVLQLRGPVLGAYALACSWLKLPPTLRLTLMLILVVRCRKVTQMKAHQAWHRLLGAYALACSWLKLPPTLRLTLKLVPLKKMKMMMDMDMEER